MSSPKRREAIQGTVAFSRGKFESNRTQQSGLNLKTTRTDPACGLTRASRNGYLCAMMLKPSCMRRCECGSSLKHRRIAAAPCVLHVHGVSFRTAGSNSRFGVFYCAIRVHGFIASIDFMGAPCGELLSSPFPVLRSFHTRTVPPACGRADGFDNSNTGNSAMTHHDAASVHAHAHTIGASSLRAFLSILSCGNIRLPARMSGRRLGGLLKQRRMTAAPCFSKARGVSFKVSTFPGVDAPSSVIRHPGRIAPSEFVMGAPGGELSSSPLPLLRSANLPGVAHLLAEVSGFSNPNRGNSAMNKHEAVNAPARALNLGLCKVLNLINCFTGKAGYVQPLGSYPATGPGMRLPSIWKVNPELLELARVEANRAAASMEVRHA